MASLSQEAVESALAAAPPMPKWIPKGAQELTVTFWDKRVGRDVEICYDVVLLEAFNQYWDVRKLPLQVTRCSHKKGSHQKKSKSRDKATDQSMPNPNPWGEFDEVEYVGVSDERENYNELVLDDEANDLDYTPEESDGDEENDDPVDDLEVNDNRGCELLIHITDVDNPRIEVGVTFEDGLCFKKCMRQYAVLKEVELAVPYSEATRYRAYCKAKKCKWSIHASRLSDGRTWQACHLFYWIPERSGARRLCQPLLFSGMFRAAYSTTVPPMPDKSLWEKVDTGFKMWPPILKRSAGRPRTRRFIGVEEGGSGKKRRRCKRCHGFGHLQKTCNEPVYDPDAPPPAPPKPKRVRKKKSKPEQVPTGGNNTMPPTAAADSADQATSTVAPAADQTPSSVDPAADQAHAVAAGDRSSCYAEEEAREKEEAEDIVAANELPPYRVYQRDHADFKRSSPLTKTILAAAVQLQC
ncbi:hypothetical protein OsJ_35784 [Oryza sativa Japonica Group]|uniref:Transposase MuDR plant domain-containing protein n=1 Tax=Oryza sativa subsp. japonica TaxID=39947 RepID=B9GCP4_ORYSJ|nr:hypothetical protein OsJ_35784 [Oryza sativa Japonica Group]